MKSSSISSATSLSSLSRVALGALGALSALSLCFAATPAHAQFSGAYAPANWTFTNNNADGSVNTTTAPAAITLAGGANGSGSPGSTTYSILANATGTVSFNWNYSTGDFYAFADPFDFLVNNTSVLNYSTVASNTGSGFFTTQVVAGDALTFRISTINNFGDRGSVTISNFSALATPPSSAAPEPGSLALLLPVAGLVGIVIRKRKTSK